MMSTDEILTGRLLFNRVNSIYGLHPEYTKMYDCVNRYETFVKKMMNKYDLSRSTVESQIHYGI